MRPRPLRPNGCVRRWSGWGSCAPAKAGAGSDAVRATGPCLRRDARRAWQTQHDETAAATSRRGRIGPTLLAFALPTLASSILQSLNGTINAIWVGRFLGEGALAATSNANMVMFLLIAFVFGFGMASTILIGQAWGRKDVDGARRVFGTATGGVRCWSRSSIAIAG